MWWNTHITKARVFCIFVVIRGECKILESLWRHPTHEWYIPPVRPFLTNLQAVRLCLRPVRMLHKHYLDLKYLELCTVTLLLYLMVLKNISPGCGVQVPLMLFLFICVLEMMETNYEVDEDDERALGKN